MSFQVGSRETILLTTSIRTILSLVDYILFQKSYRLLVFQVVPWT